MQLTQKLSSLARLACDTSLSSPSVRTNSSTYLPEKLSPLLPYFPPKHKTLWRKCFASSGEQLKQLRCKTWLDGEHRGRRKTGEVHPGRSPTPRARLAGFSAVSWNLLQPTSQSVGSVAAVPSEGQCSVPGTPRSASLPEPLPEGCRRKGGSKRVKQHKNLMAKWRRRKPH